MACNSVIQIITFFLIHTAWSDYPCICNYNVEKSIYATKSEQASPIGYMYEFDCKAQFGSVDGDWISIAFEHKVGYIHKDAQIQVQVCSGSPPTEDLVTTTMAPITTTPLVTMTATKLPVTSTTQSSKTPSITSNATHTTKASANTTPTTLIVTTPKTAQQTTVLPSTVLSQSTTDTVTTSKVSTTKVTNPSTITLLQTTSVPSTITLASSSVSSPPTTTKPSTSVTSATTVKLSSKVTVPSTQSVTVSTTELPTTKVTTVKPVQTTQKTELSCQDLLKDVVKQDNGTLFAYGKECFELLGDHTTWVNAELECKRKGGHLIDITDSNEQRVVYQVVNTYYHDSVWIGLHDRHQEEKFEWTTGKAVAYTHWYPGRKDPTHHWNEDCVAMGMNKYSGRWEDRSCNELRGFICQFGKHNVHSPALIG